jgi:hypothetical protein
VPPVALEERDAKLRLQLLDGERKSRLGDRAGGRGLAEGEVLGHRHGAFELAEGGALHKQTISQCDDLSIG